MSAVSAHVVCTVHTADMRLSDVHVYVFAVAHVYGAGMDVRGSPSMKAQPPFRPHRWKPTGSTEGAATEAR